MVSVIVMVTRTKKKPKNSSAQSAPRRTDLSVAICVHHVSTRKQCTNHMGLGTITQILGRCAVCAMCATLSRWGGGAPTAAEIELIIQQRKIQQRETKLRTLYCTGPFLFICHKTSELLHLRRLYYIIDKTDLDSIKYNRFQQTFDRTYFFPPHELYFELYLWQYSPPSTLPY